MASFGSGVDGKPHYATNPEEIESFVRIFPTGWREILLLCVLVII